MYDSESSQYLMFDFIHLNLLLYKLSVAAEADWEMK